MAKLDDLIKNGKVQECCVNCRHFALWDGDFCCVQNMEIMQFGDDFNETILLSIKTPNTCDMYEKDEQCNTKFYEKMFLDSKEHIKEKE